MLNLGTASTNVSLQNSQSGRLNGNEDANRAVFDSRVQPLVLSPGSKLRVRWSATDDTQTEHVIFGIDGLHIRTQSFPGDVDFDGDVDTADRTILVSNWTGALMPAIRVVPEPTASRLLFLGLIMFLFRNRSKGGRLACLHRFPSST